MVPPELDLSPPGPWWTHQILTLPHKPVTSPQCATGSTTSKSEHHHKSAVRMETSILSFNIREDKCDSFHLRFCQKYFMTWAGRSWKTMSLTHCRTVFFIWSTDYLDQAACSHFSDEWAVECECCSRNLMVAMMGGGTAARLFTQPQKATWNLLN